MSEKELSPGCWNALGILGFIMLLIIAGAASSDANDGFWTTVLNGIGVLCILWQVLYYLISLGSAIANWFR
jgi:hypothetical protein